MLVLEYAVDRDLLFQHVVDTIFLWHVPYAQDMHRKKDGIIGNDVKEQYLEHWTDRDPLLYSRGYEASVSLYVQQV